MILGLTLFRFFSNKLIAFGFADKYNQPFLSKLQPVLHLLKDIGERHGGKTPSQVALNWVIAKGAIPIPGIKNKSQAEENLGAIGWQLEEEEINALDHSSSSFFQVIHQR